nr:MAG TPA: hypothetical protein [Caudoviricetes sp.]
MLICNSRLNLQSQKTICYLNTPKKLTWNTIWVFL